jgi:hypothetical protein
VSAALGDVRMSNGRGRWTMTSLVAQKIMIIRHAEKPLTDGAPFGVGEDGTQGSDAGKSNLIVPGWTRAGALAVLFAPARALLQSPALARPEHLFACKFSDDGSHRPHDTLLPLSRKLGININTTYGQDDYAAMIAAAMGCPGAVLICWEHKRIQKITALIPRNGEPPDAFHWPGTRFDVVFVFDREGDRYRFSQVPELLLGTDSPAPIDVHQDGALDPEPGDETR